MRRGVYGPASIRTPDDVPRGVTLPGLADVLVKQTARREAHRDKREPLTAEHGVDVALCELALGRALADRVLSTQWVAATSALTDGALETDVAAAMGLTLDQLRDGLKGTATAPGVAPLADDSIAALFAGEDQ